MASEIFRPLRTFALIRDGHKSIEKVPVNSLGVGWASFTWRAGREGTLVGLQVHGQTVDLELELRSLNEGQSKVQWQDISFNFTLFHLWLKGLNLDEREGLITDVLSWQEEAHTKSLNESLKKAI